MAMQRSNEATAEDVREYLVYDETLGRLRWRKDFGIGKRAGKIAGGDWNNSGRIYRRITLKGKAYGEHVLVWALFNGRFPDGVIDHINHNSMDNRIENLRDVSHHTNIKNASLRANNKSGVNGVHFNKKAGKWEAQIRDNYKIVCLGRFDCHDDAAKARKEADAKYGYHKNHGTV